MADELPFGQVIDFETLPDGTATIDGEQISDQYEAAFGVTFDLINRTTGLPDGHPRVAKEGLPRTAFQGCDDGADNPFPGQGVGSSFLTDDGVIVPNSSVVFDLLITYTSPVSQASGVLIDVDCRGNGGGPPCEQWTITAFDSLGIPINPVSSIIDAPVGPPNPNCINPHRNAGPGDGLVIGWSLETDFEEISSILIQYTGEASGVGIAFDNFSPAYSAPPPSVSVTSTPWSKTCPADDLELLANVDGGTVPFTYQWQEEISLNTWGDLNTFKTQTVAPCTSILYRVIITDNDMRMATSLPFQLPSCVCEPDADFDGDGDVDMDDFKVFQELFTGSML